MMMKQMHFTKCMYIQSRVSILSEMKNTAGRQLVATGCNITHMANVTFLFHTRQISIIERHSAPTVDQSDPSPNKTRVQIDNEKHISRKLTDVARPPAAVILRHCHCPSGGKTRPWNFVQIRLAGSCLTGQTETFM